MSRPKNFDYDTAINAALKLFRERGYACTSAAMLTAAMKIGRQSLYNTFGDKWQLYRTVVMLYAEQENQAHLSALGTGPKAIDGLRAFMERAVSKARKPCLAISYLSEFGRSREDLNELHEAATLNLRCALIDRVSTAQCEGDIPPSLETSYAANFIMANVVGISLAAHCGYDADELSASARLVLQALS